MIDLCFYSPASRGGAGWYVSALAQAMADAGMRVLLIAPEMVPARREPTGANIERHVLIAGKAGQASLPVRVWRTLWRIGSIFPALLAARWRTRDYLVTMFDWIPVLVLQFLFIRMIGGRITFVVHDVTPHAWAFPARLRGVELWLYQLSYRLPDRIVSLTQSAQTELARQWGRTRDSHVIPHGVYVDGATDPLPGDGVVLVFGMLRRNKRIRESIDAMRILAAEGTALRMVIAGEPHVDDLSYWRDCESAIEGLESYIAVEAGFVAEARVAQLLGAADALLLPYEQFSSQSGVAILGAMAQRMILATRMGGVAELMELGLEAIAVDQPVTAQAIADAMRVLAAMPLEERRQRAGRSRDALANALSWQEIGGMFAALTSGRANKAS